MRIRLYQIRRWIASTPLFVLNPQPCWSGPIYWRFTGGAVVSKRTNKDLWRRIGIVWHLTAGGEPLIMGWKWRFSLLRA